LNTLTSRLVLCVLLLATVGCRQEPEIPTYWQAPAFSLTAENGLPFGSSDIGNRIVLVDFIYTNCADTCPILSATFRAIQERLKGDGLMPTKAMLISMTVDPERDTPDALKAYAEVLTADPQGWRFLTGNRETLEETLLQGFKLPFRGPRPTGPVRPGFEVSHTNRVILIDRNKTIRGLLNGEDLDVDQIVRTMQRLAN
jgi:protein SCO1/2